MRLTGQQLVWINIATPLEDGSGEVWFGGRFSIVTQIPEDLRERRRRDHRVAAIKAVVRSTLPSIVDGNAVRAFGVVRETGEVKQSPSVALRRLVHLALA